MASKLGRFIEKVRDIIQETTDKQTDILLAKFDQLVPSDESTEEPTEEAPVAEDEKQAEEVPTEELRDFKDKLFAKVDEVAESSKEERSTILEKLQSIYDTLVAYIKEDRDQESSTSNSSEVADSNPDSPIVDSSSEVADSNPDSPIVDSSSEVAQTVAASNSGKAGKGSKAGTLAILSMLRKVAAKIFSPIKDIFQAFKAFVSDRKAKLVLLVMTAITIVAGIITLLKWIYDNTVGVIVGWCQKLWDGVMWVYKKLAGLIEGLWDNTKNALDWVAETMGYEPLFGDKEYVENNAYEGLTPEQTAEKKAEDYIESKSDATVATPTEQPIEIPSNTEAKQKDFKEALERTLNEREKPAIEERPPEAKDEASASTTPMGDPGEYADLAQANPVVNNSNYNVDNKVFNLHVQGTEDYYSI